MGDYTVRKESRLTWSFEVCYRGGKTIARCYSQNDARRVAAALNALVGGSDHNSKPAAALLAMMNPI